jgi:hypothetical protein
VPVPLYVVTPGVDEVAHNLLRVAGPAYAVGFEALRSLWVGFIVESVGLRHAASGGPYKGTVSLYDKTRVGRTFDVVRTCTLMKIYG